MLGSLLDAVNVARPFLLQSGQRLFTRPRNALELLHFSPKRYSARSAQKVQIWSGPPASGPNSAIFPYNARNRKPLTIQKYFLSRAC